jgi:hypothetical protein
MNVITAADAAKGETNMIANIEETAAPQAAATAEPPKATKKASVAKRARNVAPAKAKGSKKASPTKKAPKSTKKARGSSKAAKKGVRKGSKTETILELLKRPGGATSKELMKATGWQAHSVRGFISGTLGKKMGLTVTSAKSEDGERTYSIKA